MKIIALWCALIEASHACDGIATQYHALEHRVRALHASATFAQASTTSHLDRPDTPDLWEHSAEGAVVRQSACVSERDVGGAILA